MLIYLGTGPRRYGEEPLPPSRRRGWEFQAVLKGKIAPSLPGEPQPPPLRHRLWIFQPEHIHGWAGERGRAAEVAVFHFLTVPESLKRILEPRGMTEIDLTPGEVRQLRGLARKVAPYWARPASGMMVCYEYALMALSLLASEKLGSLTEPESHAQASVNAALNWYSERMEEDPSFPEIARAVGVSGVHLRRLFHKVLQASPGNVIDQLRFQRATQLMSDPAIKLEEVGLRCGFGSASSFSRAFKAKFGASPQEWRPVNSRA